MTHLFSRLILQNAQRTKLRSRHSSEQEKHQNEYDRLGQQPQNFPYHDTHDLILRAGRSANESVNEQFQVLILDAEDFTPKTARRKGPAARQRYSES
jgi:hypothetical protein